MESLSQNLRQLGHLLKAYKYNLYNALKLIRNNIFKIITIFVSYTYMFLLFKIYNLY